MVVGGRYGPGVSIDAEIFRADVQVFSDVIIWPVLMAYGGGISSFFSPQEILKLVEALGGRRICSRLERIFRSTS